MFVVVGATVLGAGGVANAGGACTGRGCATTQQVQVTIDVGSLDQSVRTTGSNPGPNTVRLAVAKKHGHGHGGAMKGSLNTVTVTDTRGLAVGWSLSASITDLTDGRRRIDNRALRVTPRCGPTDPLSAPGVAPGPANQRADTVVTLCTKDTATGRTGSSGGTYDVEAELALDVPQAHGHTWTGTVRILLV